MFNLLYKISHNSNNAVQTSHKISKNYLTLQYNQKRIIKKLKQNIFTYIFHQ